MSSIRHKVFISYHHDNDQDYREKMQELNENYEIYIDKSVNTGDIDESLPDETIREKIRDDYLRDSTVTILLVGTETNKRKHVDWELYSSMFDGKINKKSGILIINLPSTGTSTYTATHDDEKTIIYPENSEWVSIDSRTEYETRYPYMPARIIDNLLTHKSYISVTPWSKIDNNSDNLSFLINGTSKDRGKAEYDLSQPMRRNNA